MDALDIFTTSHEEARQIASSLHSCGCCPRCILRFLGESRSSTYIAEPQELEKLLLPEEQWTSVSEVGSPCPCPACLGILQTFACNTFFERIEATVKEAGYEFSSQQCSLILPVSLIIRQRAIFMYLQKKFGKIYTGKEYQISSVKDVWKWACGRPVADLLKAQFQNRSQFDILMTFTHPESEKECSFLLDAKPDVFRRRKQRKFGFETFTRANVAKAISEMTDSKFEDNVTCPPKLPTVECSCDITCSHEAVFIAGRYQKYSRVLSQTPWLVDGKRVMEGSVQELICQPILDTFGPKDHRLSSSGREDVDVRMLGLGRPFVVELIDPHRVNFSTEDITQLQKRINDSSSDVQVRDLQLISREDTAKLKEGETDKSKVYSALCWCERELTDADLSMLKGLKDLTLQQKTPLRVLHRRSAATREKIIHSLEATNQGDNRFKLLLNTQAGTYIKEFVHGDFGRTSPNMSELLGAECDIIDLDVEAVDVDWPPYIDPLPPDTKSQASGHESTNDTFQNRITLGDVEITGKTSESSTEQTESLPKMESMRQGDQCSNSNCEKLDGQRDSTDCPQTHDSDSTVVEGNIEGCRK